LRFGCGAAANRQREIAATAAINYDARRVREAKALQMIGDR
jgi:hypothetical protein